ncbi:MAG: hydrogenase maturation protease [Microcystaceae cyanobacterium]
MIQSSYFSDILVIGYGNTLRNDDGIGRYVVEQLSPQPNVKILSVHQLTPELAAEMAGAKGVIFVDVTITEETTVMTQPLTPSSSTSSLGHSSHPQSLLTLTQTLYNHLPLAWWILIPGRDFAYGETFSEITQACIPVAIQTIENLIKTLQKSGS